jgi:glutamine---fructose-6-phosphate transaminase (isomerizing)
MKVLILGGTYMTKTYDELKQQYVALRETFEYLASKREQIVDFFKEKAPKSLTYIGCGSGYCLCKSGEFSVKKRMGIPTSSIASGDLLLNCTSYEKFMKGTMIIAPSRSGSTSEVIKAIEQVKALWDIPVLAINCVKGSDLSKIADLSLDIPWAYDTSVCQTRTVTNLYAANLLLIAFLSGDEKLVEDIDKAIKAGNDYMNENEDRIRKIAQMDWFNVVLLADGELSGLASEGATAFNEIPQVLSNQFNLLDVRHGPIVMIGKNTLVIACLNSNETLYQKELIKDLKNRGAIIVTYSDMPVAGIEGADLQVTSGMSLDVAAQGIPFIFVPQLLSYFKAELKGINPDNPNGLTAWIKL